jgi:hypothetical protein
MSSQPRRRRIHGLFHVLTPRSPAASRRRPLARPAQLSLEPLGLRQMLSVTPSITSMSLVQGPVTGGTTLQITGSNLVDAAGKSLVDKVRFYDSTADSQNSDGSWSPVVTFLTEVSSAQVTLLSGGKAAAATIKVTVPDFSAVTSWSWGPNTWIGSTLSEWKLRAAVRLKDGTESPQSPYVVFKEPNGDGTYISAGVDTTARITVGETKSSQRQDAPSDRDWWKVSLKKDTEYVFKVKPSNSIWQGNWQYSAHLVIRDSKGKAIASENRVQPGNGRLLAGIAWNKTYEVYFDPPADGDYFLDVGGSGVDWTLYELSAAKASYVSDWTLGSRPVTDDFSSNPSTKGTVAVGGAVTTAKVDVSGDRDWFKVTLNKGGKYQFSAKPSGQTDVNGNLISWLGSSYYQVTIKLRDSSGREVFTNASVGDSYSETWPDGKPIYSANKADLILTAPATGTYYVDVGAGDWSFRGYYGEGYGVGPYDLSVRALPTYAARMTPPASRRDKSTVAEGDVLTATVSTTIVPADTTLYWALSGTGITAGDFSTGGLTGSGKVSKTGGFSFSQTIAKDQATEGSETVELRLYSDADRTLQVGQTASILILDTSRTPSYRTEFGIVSGVTFTPVETIQEGASLTARLSVTNPPLDMVYYTLSGTGVAAGDFSKGSLVGSGRLVSGGIYVGDSFASLSVPLTLSRDKATEGDEVLRVAFYSDAALTTQLGTSTVVVIDKSTAAPPTYQVTASNAVVDEGGSVTATVKTTNVDPGATLYWAASGTGITAADLSPAALTGSTKVGDDTASFAFTVANDQTTEGDEPLQIKLFSDAARTKQVGNTVTVTVRDTSKTPAYSLTPSLASIDEGAALATTVATTNVPVGTQLYWSLSGTGIKAADFSTGALTGSGTVGGDGTFVIAHTVASDKTTEGNETLQIKLFSDAARTKQAGTTASVTINDTSKTPPPYAITPSLATVDEGGALTTTVATNGVASGTQLYWSLSGTGITAADFSTGALTGSGKTSSDGTFSFAHAVASDKATEMDESLQIKLFSDAARTKQVGTTATVTVRDTSLFGTAFDGAQLPAGLGLDVPSAAHASISLDTTNKELDFGASQNTDMWNTRNNVPIAWVASPVVPVGASWSVETHVRLANKDEGGQVAGLVFYGADGGRPAFTFGIDNWAWWNTGVHLQGMVTNDPSVWEDLRTAEDVPADNVFLRVVVTENGASDRYDFFYKLSAGDSWTLLTGSFESSATNSRVGLFYKTDGAKSGASFKALNLARVS